MPDVVSDLLRAQMIAEYGGEVENQFAKSSVMRQYVKLRTLTGTDTLVNRRAGRTTLQAVNDANKNSRPSATGTEFGKVQVTVDTIVLARDKRTLLNEFQTDFNARMELAQDHGKEMGKFFDESFLIQCIKGALATEAAPLNGAFGNGKNDQLAVAGDELDPTKLVKGIRGLITQFAEDEVERSELLVWVRPTEFQTLLDADKLINTDYSAGNGDYAMGRIAMIEGARIVETTRIPTAVNAAHLLGASYNVTADMAKACAVIMHPRSLLAAETIPMTPDIWYNKEELCWFIQNMMAYGVTANRYDLCGVLLKA